MIKLNESKSIMNAVNDYLNKDRMTTLSALDQAIVNNFNNMNISLELYNETIDPFMKQLNESKSIMNDVNYYLNKDRMNKFSNIPEPRFLPRIDFQKGSEYFKNGFGKLTNITLPTFSFSDNENNTSDNWRTDNGNYSISVVEETD
jgi:hypothetical protein